MESGIRKLGKEKEDFIYRCVYLGCIGIILAVCLYTVSMHQRIRVVDDEFAYWGIAAQLAGYDWSDALSVTGFYSYGYSFLLVPLFLLHRLGVGMTALYRIAVGMNAVLLCFSFCIAVAVGRYFFESVNRFYLLAAALVSVMYFGNITQSGHAWTEVYLAFMFWCVLYCLIRALESGSVKWYLLLLLAAANLFAIHMRTIGVAAAVVLILLFRFLSERIRFEKKTGRVVIAGLLFLTAGLLLFRFYIKNYIYANNASSVLNDFSGQIWKIKILFSVSGMLDFMLSVAGKLFYIGVAGWGLPFFALFLMLKGLWTELRNAGKKKEKLSARFFVLLFCVMAAAGAVFVDALFKIWCYYSLGVTNVVADIVVYGRYVDFIMGPLILFGLLVFVKWKEHVPALAGSYGLVVICGLISQKMWDVLAFYQGSEITLRETAVPGITYMYRGNTDKLAFILMLWAAGAIFLLMFIHAKGRKSWFSAVSLIILVICLSVCGNQEIKRTIEGKSHKEKTVSSITRLIKDAADDMELYYITGSEDVNGDMKMLQWELADREIRLVDSLDELDEGTRKKAVFLADDRWERQIANLTDSMVFLYDSGTLSVFAEKENDRLVQLQEAAQVAGREADPRSGQLELSQCVAEYGYQKANGWIYFGEQRTEGYLTWQTGIELPDGIYEFVIDMELNYYDGGDIGFVTCSDMTGEYYEVRPLQESDFGRSGRGKIAVILPVRDFVEPVVGVYTKGNGAMKIASITYRQIQGNVDPMQGRGEEWQVIAEKLSAEGAGEESGIVYLDSDRSARAGFPDFSSVNVMLPAEISGYISGDMLPFKESWEEEYLIAEPLDDEARGILFETYTEVLKTEHYSLLKKKDK